MVRSGKLVLAMFLLWSLHAPAHAQAKHSETRGELLYSTHCSACHSDQIHWREKKLATDWSSLIVEVRRWQANIGLVWNEAEIEDTARYLNILYYHFPIIDTKGSMGGY
ncbi:MAG: hypothetical protein A3K04_00480 [Gallionellales bacterium RBG_16_56_9]|nr:MAG: hypothetical protein A3K04_00480 [Gallionellales bacterium RBG_16_56_9]